MKSALLHKRAFTGFPNEVELLAAQGDRLFEVDSLRQPGLRMLVALAEDGTKDYPVYDPDKKKVKFQSADRFGKKFKDAVKKHMKAETDAAETPEEEDEATNDPSLRKAAASSVLDFPPAATGKENGGGHLKGDGTPKRSHPTRADAERFAENRAQRFGDYPLRAYQCPTCEQWHLTKAGITPFHPGDKSDPVSRNVASAKTAFNVVLQDKNGFITDFGENQTLTNTETGENSTIGRFGVWQDVGGKPQVTFVTDDLEKAKSHLMKIASTGLECQFIEYKPNQWYYLLENWDSPKGGWDWRESATAYGPFASQEIAEDHLQSNHANPGGWSAVSNAEVDPNDKALNDAIAHAQGPKKGLWASKKTAIMRKCVTCHKERSVGRDGQCHECEQAEREANPTTRDWKPGEWFNRNRGASSIKIGGWSEIRPGDRLTIKVPAGFGRNGQEWTEKAGRVVMRSSNGGWVLNMGGPHGTPGVATQENTTKIQHKKASDQWNDTPKLDPAVVGPSETESLSQWKEANTVHDLKPLLAELQNSDALGSDRNIEEAIQLTRKLIGIAKQVGARGLREAARHYLAILERVTQYSLPGSAGYFAGANPIPPRTRRASERAFKRLEAEFVHFVR